MRIKSLFLITGCLALAACGGGGSGSSGQAAVSDGGEAASGAFQQATSSGNGGGSANGCALTAYQAEMLEQLNAVRTQARYCGEDYFEAVPELTYSCAIEPAARSHSIDMATNNFFSHTGSNGLRVSHRVTETGYEWGVVGENIAAGFSDVSSVMAGWLNSPGHCRNIMDSRFQEFAVSRVNTSTADYPNYWTQVFAVPR